MATKSHMQWTESTWNPVTGCTKISPGCLNCYAERMTKRLKAMGQTNDRNGFDVTCHEHVPETPLTWKKPQTVFVNSMSDPFHEDIPVAFIKRTFDIMQRAHWHRFQVLTKRAERLPGPAHELPWPDNVWMDVTVETADCAHRAELLNAPLTGFPCSRKCPATKILEAHNICKEWAGELQSAGLHLTFAALQA